MKEARVVLTDDGHYLIYKYRNGQKEVYVADNWDDALYYMNNALHFGLAPRHEDCPSADDRRC